MTALVIIVAVLLCIWGISLVRIGGWLEYSESGLLVRLKLGPLRIQLFPMKPRAKKQKPSREKKPAEPSSPPPAKRGGTFQVVKECLPVVAEAAGSLKRNICIDEFQMDLLWSSPNPAACAVGFGAANAAVGMIWPIVEQNFKVKQYRIRTAVEFDRGSPTVYLLASASLTVGQGIGLGLRLAVQGAKAYRRARPVQKKTVTSKQKEAV